MRQKDITAKTDSELGEDLNKEKDIIVKMLTPYALVEIKIKAEDSKMKDDIIDWIFEGCSIMTKVDKLRFDDKYKEIKRLIKEAKRRIQRKRG